jgi:hypothetical protein
MTVIQGPIPAAGTSPKLSQASAQDNPQTEAFGLSMLLALLAPQATPVTQQQPVTTVSGQNTESNPEGEGTSNQSTAAVAKETIAGQSTTSGSQAPTELVPKAKTSAETPVQVKHQPVPLRDQPETAKPAYIVDAHSRVESREKPTISTDAVPKRPPSESPIPLERFATAKAPPPQLTIESAEVSSARQHANTQTPRSNPGSAEATARFGDLPTASASRQGAEETAASSFSSMPKSTPENVRGETHASAQRAPVEGQPVQTLAQDKVSAETIGQKTEESPKRFPSTQRQASPRRMLDRTRAALPDRQGIREHLAANTAEKGTESADADETSTRPDRVAQRAAVQTGIAASTDQESQTRARLGTNSPSHVEAAVPVLGSRPTGGIERAVSQRSVDGQVQQTVANAPAEDPVFQPKPEDRVTLRFTDEGGTEGRLRVALRGESLRATIVSGDPATAERIGAGVSELQRALDKQGFRDPQITVQQARGPDEGGGVAIASGVRAGPESSAGAPTARTLEDQAQRDRQQPGPRDNQHQNSGRSQQRSRERQER